MKLAKMTESRCTRHDVSPPSIWRLYSILLALTDVLGECGDVHALDGGARAQEVEDDDEVELHDDLEVGGGRAVDGVQVDRRVVRLLDLLRALLVEDLAQGAGVPAIEEGSSTNDFLIPTN